MAKAKKPAPAEVVEEPGVAAPVDVNADPVALGNMKRLYALALNPDAAGEFEALRSVVVEG